MLLHTPLGQGVYDEAWVHEQVDEAQYEPEIVGLGINFGTPNNNKDLPRLPSSLSVSSNTGFAWDVYADDPPSGGGQGGGGGSNKRVKEIEKEISGRNVATVCVGERPKVAPNPNPNLVRTLTILTSTG
jgi:hypothetical protein